MPYWVYKPTEATTIPYLHVQNNEDNTIITVITIECHTIRTY